MAEANHNIDLITTCAGVHQCPVLWGSYQPAKVIISSENLSKIANLYGRRLTNSCRQCLYEQSVPLLPSDLVLIWFSNIYKLIGNSLDVNLYGLEKTTENDHSNYYKTTHFKIFQLISLKIASFLSNIEVINRLPAECY